MAHSGAVNAPEALDDKSEVTQDIIVHACPVVNISGYARWVDAPLYRHSFVPGPLALILLG